MRTFSFLDFLRFLDCYRAFASAGSIRESLSNVSLVWSYPSLERRPLSWASHRTILLNFGKMNAAHLRAIFGNWCTRGTDHIVVDMYAKKFYKAYFADPVQYNYLFVSFFAVGCAATMCLRHVMLNPDICVRRGDARRHFIDRWQHHLYSLPYYNHYLRNFALRFQNSFVDNEPDYLGSHPWGVRPTRCLNYGRVPFTFMNPYQYFVDDPQYVSTLHGSMEKHYEALGYYPSRAKNTEEE